MIWWWILILVMILMAVAMLAVAVLLASGEDVVEFQNRALTALQNRFVPILRAAGASITVYAIPLLIEWALLKRELNPWLVCVLLADLPGALLLYRLGCGKTAIVTYATATLLEATLLSNGITPRQVMMLNNVGPAVAVGMAIAGRTAVDCAAPR